MPTPENRPSAAERGYGARWQRFSRRYRRKHPLCECGCGRPSEVVHHLDGLGPLGPRGFDPDNCQALAKVCHDRETAKQQPGGWAKRPPRRRPAPKHPGMIE
jgi:5-methylcytosine-specific restriction protein A